MGRTLKRVPLDFDWPKGMLWKGYVNPYHAQQCKPCDRSGLNPETKQIADDFYDFAKTGRRWCDKITQDEVDALIAKDRLWDFWRRVGPNGWEDITPRPVVTAAQVNAAQSGPGFLSHDAINRGILVRTRATRLGVYGLCRYCDGHGEVWYSPEIQAKYDTWKEYEPPTGEGYQLWETTSEGSPTSPVFPTLDALCAWCETNATTFGSFRATASEWKKMLEEDFVRSEDGHGNVFM